MEHQGWGNLWAEPKPWLQAAGRGLGGSWCPPKARCSPAHCPGWGSVSKPGDLRGDQQTQCTGDAGSGLSSQPCGAELQRGPIWRLGVLVASLLPLLGRFGSRGVPELG